MLSEVQYCDDGLDEGGVVRRVRVPDWMVISEISAEEYEKAQKTAFDAIEGPEIFSQGDMYIETDADPIHLERGASVFSGYIYLGHTKALGGMHVVHHEYGWHSSYTYYSMKTGKEMLSSRAFPKISSDQQYALALGFYGERCSAQGGLEDYEIASIALYELKNGEFELIIEIPFKNWGVDRSKKTFWGEDGAFYGAFYGTFYTKDDNSRDGYMKIVLKD